MALNVALVLTAQADQLKAGVEQARQGLAGLGEAAGQLGKALSLGVTAPLAAIGGAALAAGKQIDAAYDTIRVGTGATGEALAGLQRSFDVVFRSVPAGAADVAAAIADLNTRAGLTGPALEQTAEAFVRLAGLGRESVGGLVTEVTRATAAFGQAPEELAGGLDLLFRVSQQTGIGVGALAGQLRDAAPVLQSLGLDFAESAALLGQLDKAGVNAQRVILGLQAGVKDLAGDGGDMGAAFQALVAQLGQIEDPAERAKAAIEAFGQRGGLAIAEAARAGAFGIEALAAAIRDSGDTVLAVSRQTEDFDGALGRLQNTATLAAGALGLDLMRGLSSGLEQLAAVAVPALESIVEAWRSLDEGTRDTIVQTAAVVGAAGPLALAISGLVAVVTAALAFPAGAIALVLVGAVAAWAKWGEDIKAELAAVVDAVVAARDSVVERLGAISDAAVALRDRTVAAVQGLVEGVRTWLVDRMNELVDLALTPIRKIEGAWSWLYEKVVGGSWVPDLVTETGEWLATMGDDLARAADQVGALGAAFETLAATGGAPASGGALAQPIDEARRSADTYAEALRQITSLGDEVGDAIAGGFEAAILSGKGLQETLRDLALDLARVILRMAALEPLARGISGGIASWLAPTAQAAQGVVVDGGRITAFAAGGVVDRPTLFGLRGGAGLMGEAGPEAILPLRRGADGRLGVAAQGTAQPPVQIEVRVVDQRQGGGSAPIETRIGQDAAGRAQIDVLIRGSVEGLIARGALDAAMARRYGARPVAR